MNIRDVAGVSSQKELYELATVGYGLCASSMENLVAFVIEIQQRALQARDEKEKA